MSAEFKLDLLALLAVVCLVVGEAYGWPWYLQICFWMIFCSFWTIIWYRCWRRKRKKRE